MAKTIIRGISIKTSVAKPPGKPPGKPPSGVKSLRIDPAICFYELEYGDKTK